MRITWPKQYKYNPNLIGKIIHILWGDMVFRIFVTKISPEGIYGAYQMYWDDKKEWGKCQKQGLFSGNWPIIIVQPQTPLWKECHDFRCFLVEKWPMYGIY